MHIHCTDTLKLRHCETETPKIPEHCMNEDTDKRTNIVKDKSGLKVVGGQGIEWCW